MLLTQAASVRPYPSRISIPVRPSKARNTSVGIGAAPHSP